MAEFTEKDFLKELNLDTMEREFIKCLLRNKADKATRAAYADWLLEHDRKKSAKAVREGYTPGYGWWAPTGDISPFSGIMVSGSLVIPLPRRLSSGGI